MNINESCSMYTECVTANLVTNVDIGDLWRETEVSGFMEMPGYIIIII